MTNSDEIKSQCSTLKLPYISAGLDRLLLQAQSEEISYSDFLKKVFQCEMDGRTARSKERRMKEAGFPYIKRLEDFDLGFCGSISRKQFNQLCELTWIDGIYNLILTGPPGVGKTHLAIGLGMKACEEGYRVSYTSMQSLVRILRTQEIDRASKIQLNRIHKSQLLIIDEVGYLPITTIEGNLFFQLISSLQEQCSIVITTNKGFEEWAEFLGDAAMASAVLDRLSFRCDRIKLYGKSYRRENHTSFLKKNEDTREKENNEDDEYKHQGNGRG